MQCVVCKNLTRFYISGLFVLFLLVTPATGNAYETGLKPGQQVMVTESIWPDKYRIIEGDDDRGAVLIFKSGARQEIEPPPPVNILEIKDQTHLYLPENTLVVSALPKTYKYPQLAKGIRKFYTRNIPLYGTWLLLLGLVLVK